MRLKTDRVKKLNNWIGALSSVVDKITLRASTDGINQRSRDPAHICMTDFKLDKSEFKTLTVTGDEEIITIDAEDFSKILRRLKKDDEIEIETDDSESELIIKSDNGSSKEFSIPLLSKRLDEEQDLSKLKFDSKINMDISTFIDELKNVSLMGEHVGIKTSSSEFEIFSSEGRGNYTSTFEADDLDSFESTNPSKSVFQVDYLETILNSFDKDNDIEIAVADNTPIKISLVDDESYFDFLQAPLIKD